MMNSDEIDKLIADHEESARALETFHVPGAAERHRVDADALRQLQADNQRLVAESRDLRTALECVQIAIQEAEQDDTLSLADTIDDEMSARIDAALQQEQERNDE